MYNLYEQTKKQNHMTISLGTESLWQKSSAPHTESPRENSDKRDVPEHNKGSWPT